MTGFVIKWRSLMEKLKKDSSTLFLCSKGSNSFGHNIDGSIVCLFLGLIFLFRENDHNKIGFVFQGI